MNNRDQIGSSAMKNAAESPNGDRGTIMSSPMSKERHTLKQCVALTAYIVSAWIVFLGIANKSEMQYKFGGTVWQISSQQTNPTNNALIANSIIPDPKTKRNNSLKINNNKKFRNISQDEVDPPYEKLWPKYVLPMWARKSVNYEVLSEESICFVHVGKAGGSAVGCSLGFSLHCNKSSQIKGILPKMTTNTFHKDVYNCHDNSAYFLFVIRDPLDRARSAFNYDRPDPKCNHDPYLRLKQFYMDCPFWTMEDMAQNGLLNSNNTTSDTCKTRATTSLQGTNWYGSHLYFNYQYYYEAVPQDAPILVIRNEHIAEDWNTVEGFLGGKKDRLNSQESIPKYNAYQQSEQDLFISDESRSALCHALCNEIQVYKRILTQAQNLNDGQIRVSMAELESKCPEEASMDSCPAVLPDISNKLKASRGY